MLAVILCLYPLSVLAASGPSSLAPEALATQYLLTTSTSIPFPSATQQSSQASSFITLGWSLGRGKIENGNDDLAFVKDPFPTSTPPGVSESSGSNTNIPVLQVTYPKGSYSHGTGGAQMYSLWNTSGSPFQSMMLSYEVTFDPGFNWVKGGKLPGLMGGPDTLGCSGGSEPNGTDCFSTRLMWRSNGAGEVYGYLLTPNNLCSSKDVICNSDFGISFGRGSFTFASGQWNRVTLLVQLNDPPSTINGNILLYFNNVLAVSQQNLQFRNGSNVNIGGMFFSTFFGGNDESWETPNTTHTYFRNFQLWGSSSSSTLTGMKAGAVKAEFGWSWLAGLITTFIFSLGF